MSNFKGIDHYLQIRRQQSELSQEELAERLAEFAAEFRDIDGLTVSRWERGKVEPNFSRQQLLMSYFGDNPVEVMSASTYQSKQLGGVEQFHKTLSARSQFKHYMGAHPYLPHQPVILDSVDGTDPQALRSIPLICAYVSHLSQDRLRWSPEWLSNLQQHPGFFGRYYYFQGLLSGHNLSVRIRANWLEALEQGKLQEQDISTDMLARPGEECGLYILSMYLGRTFAIEQTLREMFRLLFEEQNIQSISIQIRRDVAQNILGYFPYQICSFGPECDKHQAGVKYQNKRYFYYTIRIEREALLNTPIVISLLRQ